MNVERRKFKRHRVPESTLFMFDHDTNQMAAIMDISINGLKFQYFPFSDDKTEWKTVDLFCSGPNRFHLLGIPCRLVYNLNSLSKNLSFTGSFAKTSGVKFDRMTAFQRKKLESAIAIIDAGTT